VIFRLAGRGGRLWLAVLVVSVLMASAAVWLLAVGNFGYVMAGAQSSESSELSSATAEPSLISRSSAPRRQRGDKAPNWPTHQATPASPKSGGPGSPRTLIISRLSLEMPIVPMKVDGDDMALPANPNQIGWYSYGPRPGDQQGSAVLGGHVDSREYGIGPLIVLRRLHEGDVIIVRTTVGRETFRVSSVRLIRKQALPLRTVFDRESERRLRLITCGGPYIASRGGYQDNLVVTAIPEGRTHPDRSAPPSSPGRVQG
jgi:hypothetical protein